MNTTSLREPEAVIGATLNYDQNPEFDALKQLIEEKDEQIASMTDAFREIDTYCTGAAGELTTMISVFGQLEITNNQKKILRNRAKLIRETLYTISDITCSVNY